MEITLNYLLEIKPDFYELTQREQIKYVCYIFSKNKDSLFNQKGIKELFDELNLVIPSHISEEFANLSKGKNPFLVKKKNGYVIHPLKNQELTLEFFSAKSGTPSEKVDNIQLFSKYEFHPVIKRVSFKQFQEGFYKEAIQNALVEVITQVKLKTGNPKVEINGRIKELDGDDLMNKVFGCDGAQVPLIKFNSLSSSLEKSEQRGILNLFKGIVGIRDKKAHLNFVQNDPIKTIEYLSLASLLLRLLDENSI